MPTSRRITSATNRRRVLKRGNIDQIPPHYPLDAAVSYVKSCDIESQVVQFFERILNKPISSIDPCKDIGPALLHKCVSPEEIQYYTFEKVLGFGLNGFVFQCIYKNTERRAVKMVLISDKKQAEKVTSSKTIYSVTKNHLKQEFNVHHQMLQVLTPSSQFNVLNIFGDLAIFNPPLSKYEIGIYIMQSLPAPTLLGEIIQHGGKITPAIYEKLKTIPRVIANIQEHGYAHSDLHTGNISFDPSDPDRPIVLDFGRTVNLTSTFHNVGELATFRFFDYVNALDCLVLNHKTYNALLGIMNTTLLDTLREISIHVPTPQKNILREIFTTLMPGKNKERQKLIYEVRKQKFFNNETANFFQIVEPS